MAGLVRFHPEVKRYCIAPPDEVGATADALGELAEFVPAPRRIPLLNDGWQPYGYRYFLPHFAESAVAWVDSDVIACGPVRDLWDVPPGRINAVRDVSPRVANIFTRCETTRLRFEELFPAAAGRQGFNSGVLALRPADWPNFTDDCFRRLTDEPYHSFWSSLPRVNFIDQPIINALLLDAVNWLPERFNFHSVFNRPIPDDVGLLHFTSRTKPWMPHFPRHEPGYYYWVRYGEMETRPSRLWKVRAWTILNAPRVRLSRAYRQWTGRRLGDWFRRRPVAK